MGKRMNIDAIYRHIIAEVAYAVRAFFEPWLFLRDVYLKWRIRSTTKSLDPRAEAEQLDEIVQLSVKAEFRAHKSLVIALRLIETQIVESIHYVNELDDVDPTLLRKLASFKNLLSSANDVLKSYFQTVRSERKKSRGRRTRGKELVPDQYFKEVMWMVCCADFVSREIFVKVPGIEPTFSQQLLPDSYEVDATAGGMPELDILLKKCYTQILEIDEYGEAFKILLSSFDELRRAI